MIDVLQHEVAALRMLQAGDSDGAIESARMAAEMEVTYLRVPSGPPMPIKPAGELYADVLLETGNAAEAMKAYQASLNWILQRTPSLLGLAEAALQIGDVDTATKTFERLRSMPGLVREAKKAPPRRCRGGAFLSASFNRGPNQILPTRTLASRTVTRARWSVVLRLLPRGTVDCDAEPQCLNAGSAPRGNPPSPVPLRRSEGAVRRDSIARGRRSASRLRNRTASRLPCAPGR